MNNKPQRAARRRLIGKAAALVLTMGLMAAGSAMAQAAWPSKPVRLIVPAAAGSAPDVVARLLADKLGAAWNQTLIVDNKPGAGGIPGMSALARSTGDGYTIGFVPAAMGTITPLVYKNPQFNPDTELQSAATVGISPLLFATSAANGIQSLADLARAGKAQPGKLNLAAPQPNSLPHLASELLSKTGAMSLYTVPYPGPPAAVTAVIAGDATLTADGVPGLLPHIKSGRLRALGVSSAQRLPGLDVPAVAETYPGFEVVGWFQLLVPTGTPAAVIERINAETNRITRLPEVVAKLAELGVYPRQDSVAASHEFFVAQQKAMKRLVGELGVQAQ